jgi:hypothetical protein
MWNAHEHLNMLREACVIIKHVHLLVLFQLLDCWMLQWVVKQLQAPFGLNLKVQSIYFVFVVLTQLKKWSLVQCTLCMTFARRSLLRHNTNLSKVGQINSLRYKHTLFCPNMHIRGRPCQNFFSSLNYFACTQTSLYLLNL